jgi:hypothetical protein
VETPAITVALGPTEVLELVVTIPADLANAFTNDSAIVLRGVSDIY